MLLIVGIVILGLGLCALFAAYWPYILGALAIGLLFNAVTNRIEAPVEAEARKLIDVDFRVNDSGSGEFGGYRHQVQFTITNKTPNQIISGLYFSCEGGRSRVHPARLRPGQSLTDSLRVEWAESLDSCVPVYELDEVA